MSKTASRKKAGVAPNTMTRLRRDEEVTLGVLYKICAAVDANIGDMGEIRLGSKVSIAVACLSIYVS